MFRFGAPELVILLIIVILLFGVGRIGKIAGELGSGIKAFRKGLESDDSEKAKGEPAENKQDTTTKQDTTEK
jgi:sec-independent protein translocase protein TatA